LSGAGWSGRLDRSLVQESLVGRSWRSPSQIRHAPLDPARLEPVNRRSPPSLHDHKGQSSRFAPLGAVNPANFSLSSEGDISLRQCTWCGAT
jgi:hypothetical protein